MPSIRDRRRQRERLRQRRLRAVERGVEAGDLRQPGPQRGQGAHRRQVVRQVQRRERNQAGQPIEHGVVQRHRSAEVDAAVHDAVTDRAHAVAVQVALGEIDQVCHPGLVVERRRPGMFTDCVTGGVAGDEARGAPIQPIDLAREESAPGQAAHAAKT